MSPQDFHVRPGQSIRPAIKRLAAFVLGQAKMQSGGGIRMHRQQNGTTLIADRQASAFVGRFAVRVSQKKAIVGAGRVDSLVPTINGKPIDGDTPPELTIDGSPNEALRSWLCIEAIVSKEAKTIDTDADSPLIITHRNDLTLSASPSLPVSLSGIKPIAMLVWSDTATIQRVEQIVYFDQQIIVEDDRVRFEAAS